MFHVATVLIIGDDHECQTDCCQRLLHIIECNVQIEGQRLTNVREQVYGV